MDLRFNAPRLRFLFPLLPALGGLGMILVVGTPSRNASILFFLIVCALSAAAIRITMRGSRDRMRTIGNLLEALRGGDYGVRSAVRGDDSRLAEQFNALARHLHEEQRAQQEGIQMLANALSALDGAVLTFDRSRRLRWANPAGNLLLGAKAQLAIGQEASQLGLSRLFDLSGGTVDGRSFGIPGRWQVKCSEIRSRSQSGWMLVLQPIERELREEEAQAFKRMLRVLSHEINNSMAPIASMADTITRFLPKPGSVLDAENFEDITEGLTIIEQRSEALRRFLAGYVQLAQLPPPQPKNIPLKVLLERLMKLTGESVRADTSTDVWLVADLDQLEQVFLNLVRNATEAGGSMPVRITAEIDANVCSIKIIDQGTGLPESGNLFVPFFTTKPQGSGIGLVLSRQIVEAQGGTLELSPGMDGVGAVAEVRLPAGVPADDGARRSAAFISS